MISLSVVMSDIVPITLPDFKSEPLPYVVGITSLHPGNHNHFGKFFQCFNRVDNPYDGDQGGVRALINGLVDTVHQLSRNTYGNLRLDPNPGEIENKLERINGSTSQHTDFGGKNVPDHIHYAALALFRSPVAESMQFAYGLMMAYGDISVRPVEFAVLLPEKRIADQPAVLLSNGFEKGHEAGMQYLIDILNFGWNYEPSVPRQIWSSSTGQRFT